LIVVKAWSEDLRVEALAQASDIAASADVLDDVDELDELDVPLPEFVLHPAKVTTRPSVARDAATHRGAGVSPRCRIGQATAELSGELPSPSVCSRWRIASDSAAFSGRNPESASQSWQTVTARCPRWTTSTA